MTFLGTQYDPQISQITNFIPFNRTLGTPDEVNWPGVTDLANYKSTFPKWQAQDLKKVFPTLPYDAIDLLKVYICLFLLLFVIIQGKNATALQLRTVMSNHGPPNQNVKRVKKSFRSI
jgi:hypothetical protein